MTLTFLIFWTNEIPQKIIFLDIICENYVEIRIYIQIHKFKL